MCIQRFLSIAILLSSLSLSAAAIPSVSAANQSLRDYVLHNQRRQAYGLYMKRQKLGWAIDELKLGRYADRDVAVETFESEGNYTAGRERSSFASKSVTFYALEGEGEVVYAEDTDVEDAAETRRTAVREGNQLLVTTRTKAGESQRHVPVPKETLQLSQQLDQWLTSGPRKGSKFESYSTSWDRDDVNTKELYTYRGKKRILWGGVPTGVFLVMANIDGMQTEYEVTSDGTPIKGLMGGFFEMRAEKEALAKKPGSQPVDMLEASSIRVGKDLGDTSRIDSLTLQVTGLGKFNLPTSHRQRIHARKGDSVVLELLRDRRSAHPAPLSPEKRLYYLKSTPDLQSDHPSIRSKASEIIGDETDALKKADRLQRWLFSNIRQTMAANTTTALDVLNQRAGDCTEITLLFVALARAAEIPAREVGGIMYANEGVPLFGWHAWAEIHDGFQWVSIDPTWNQVYVDATHLKLSEDSTDLAWVNLLGRIRIHIVKLTKK